MISVVEIRKKVARIKATQKICWLNKKKLTCNEDVAWFVCFYDLLNWDLFRVLPNIQDGVSCQNSSRLKVILDCRIKSNPLAHHCYMLKYIACLK